MSSHLWQENPITFPARFIPISVPILKISRDGTFGETCGELSFFLDAVKVQIKNFNTKDIIGITVCLPSWNSDQLSSQQHQWLALAIEVSALFLNASSHILSAMHGN